MNKSPVIVIDDDQDDLEVIRMAADSLQIDRPFHYFKNGKEVVDFLKTSEIPPFMIICDVNMPGEDGFAIRKLIADEPLFKYHTVPFIFWSTSGSDRQVQEAFDLPAQGYFFKPDDFEVICKTLQSMIDYWEGSRHPKLIR